MAGGTTCEAVSDLLTAEALDVADPQQRLTTQEHLATCTSCSNEVAEMREAAALIGAAAPQLDPPRGLRTRVVAAALAERAARRRALPPRLSVFSRRPTPLWGAVAAAIVVSLGSLAWAASLQAQLASVNSQLQIDRERAARYERVVGVLASPELTTRALEPASGPEAARGTVYLDPLSGQGMVMVHDLPDLPPGHTWQLWFVRGDVRVSGGLVRTDSAGRGYSFLTVPTDLQRFEAIGITQEPAGGSPAPTTPRVIGTPL